MKQPSDTKSSSGCGLGCLVLVLALVALFGHMLYVWPAANILHVGKWVPAEEEGYTFVFDADAQFLGVYVTGCLVALIGGSLVYLYQALNKSPVGRWAKIPSPQNFEQLAAVVEGQDPACLLEFQSRRETRIGRPGLGFFSGMFWILAGLQLGNALIGWEILSAQALGPRCSFPRLGMLAVLVGPGLWKMLVGFQALVERSKIDDRLLIRWQERDIYLVDLLSGREGELYLPFSKIQRVELTTSKDSDQQTCQLSIQAEGEVKIPLWSVEFSRREQVKAVGHKLAERLGCPFKG